MVNRHQNEKTKKSYEYSMQAYRPGHHNFTEDFLFEPGLDPGVSKAII